jgi:hypothetical protein
VDQEYELFEQLPDGSPIWRGHVQGLRNARAKLEEIAGKTTNECFAIHLPTKEIVVHLNAAPSPLPPGKRLIFQIAYDSKIAAERAQLLRMCGYEVVSVIGNEAAKVVLSMSRPWDLFIVGRAANEDSKEEIVGWLKKNYSSVPILSLNSPGIRDLPGADYNARVNGSEVWLSMVATALRTA